MECKECQPLLPPFKHFATDAIHVGQDPEQWSSWAVVPPITLSTVFKQEEPGKNRGYEYTRFGNPNRHVLEKVAAALDGAKYCLAFSSGMGAILNICHLLKTGDKIVCTAHVYEGTRVLFKKIKEEYNLKVDYVDCTNPKCLESKITPDTKLVWLESPTNPTLKVIDIRACADVAHKKQKGVLVAVDNSFMSPYFQRPLSLGADICMSSATKYINGHSDVLLGLVSVNEDCLYEKLKFLQISLGAVPSPFDCYMCNRGLKTLHIRMKLHFHNGLAVAEFLKHRRHQVKEVIYPGLDSHCQCDVTKKQCTGVSGMVSFYIKGEKKNAFAFLKSLKVFTLAFSLGGFESLAEHPATMSHASVPEKEREALGITDTLIRLSVGLEDEEDLIKDLDQALEAAASMRTDERKRNSLSWTRREEQKQSHSSHKPCAPFPGSVSKPWAAFGEGFHASKELSTHFCSILDQEMGSLYSKSQDSAIRDCTTNTWLRREVPQDITWSCSCLFPDIWLVVLGFLWLLLGCAVLSSSSGCVSLGVCPAPGALRCLCWGRAPLVLPPFPSLTGIARDLKSHPSQRCHGRDTSHCPSCSSPSVQPGLGHCQGSRGIPSSPSLCSLPSSQKCLNLDNCAALLLLQVFVHAVAFSKGFFWIHFGS